MTKRSVPPKVRGAQPRTPLERSRREKPQQQDDTRGYSAPSHMGGQFEEARYSAGSGVFGFTQSVVQ